MNGPKTERVELPRVCPFCRVRTAENTCNKCGRETFVAASVTYDGGGIPGGKDKMTAQEIKDLVAVNDKKEEADSAHAYTFRGQCISKRMMVPIRAYINHGMRPGPFLEAIICNNLLEAFGQADDENYPNIHAFIGYFYNKAPSGCWGSKGEMEAWIDRKLVEREGEK